MTYELTPYSIHELGQRQNQEDSIFPAYGESTSEDRLFILCDGMGGHEKGEVASATVCEAMSNTILSRWNHDEPLSDGLLLQAIEDAYDALDAKDNGEIKKMGTTMTFLCFHSEGVTVAHIGDSRVYQFRPGKGAEPARILFQTRDHSLVNDLIKIGEITEEEAKNHLQKNVITRAMQPCQERRSKADIAHLTDIKSGDYFYMCSDGMLEQTSDENLLFIITNSKSSNEQKKEMLRSVTEENKDNHTAHLIYISKVKGTPSVAPITNSVQTTNIPTTGESSQRPQGTWITPEEPKKKNKLPFIIIALILLAAIAAGVYYFQYSLPKQEEIEEVNNDTIEHIDAISISVDDEGVKNTKSSKSKSTKADNKKENASATNKQNEETVTTTPLTEENKEEKKDTTKDSKKSAVDITKFTPKKPKTNN